MTACVIAQLNIMILYPLLLEDRLGFGPNVFIIYLFAHAVQGVIGSAYGVPIMMHRWGLSAHSMSAICCFIVAVNTTCTGIFSSKETWVKCLHFFFSMTYGLFASAFDAGIDILSASYANEENKGTIFGIIGSSGWAAYIIAPNLGLFLYTQSIELCFIVNGVIAAIGSLALVYLQRNYPVPLPLKPGDTEITPAMDEEQKDLSFSEEMGDSFKIAAKLEAGPIEV